MSTSIRNGSCLEYPFLLAALVSAGAWAAQPPDVVQSDGNGDTAMGTNALLNAEPTGSGYGSDNTAAGYDALYFNVGGEGNTALGNATLANNVTGSDNTATGKWALLSNTDGSGNTATGSETMIDNTTGSQNTATGLGALYRNTTGAQNTASGYQALTNNETGLFNTADGFQALYSTTASQYNTASGYMALYADTGGSGNTAVGATALLSNTTAYNNSAFGSAALHDATLGGQNSGFGAYSLHQTTVGANNVAVGYQAMYSNTSGSSNVAIGLNAGYNLTTGSNNIDISNSGSPGDSATIKIGTESTQTKTFIAGIANAKVTGAAVYVTSSGQLGVLASSERYKTDIAPMGAKTGNLEQLRPVTFHLKADPQGEVQYGLIAEEVDKVYPELVIRDDKGVIQGVRYDELAPMLLNEVQQQKAQLQAMKQQVSDLTQVLKTAMREQGVAPQVARR